MGQWLLFSFGVLVASIWGLRLRETLRFYSGSHIMTEFSHDAVTFPAPLVSVVIPARNEESNIGRCLESLLHQDYPNYELIVVDDRSQDRTAAIVKEFAAKSTRVRLVSVWELPQGWCGKTHALATGVASAAGAWLLFTDADTVHRPRSISTSLGHALLREADMLSLLPSLENLTFWEKVLQPVVGAALMLQFPVQKVNDPRSKKAFGNGQYILIKKEVYEKLGGYARLKEFILEDIAIANLVKENGYRLHVAYGADLFKTRMYSTFRAIWQGWTRIFYSGLGKSAPVIFGMMVLVLIVSLAPYAMLVYSLMLLAADPLATFSLSFFGLMLALFFLIYPSLVNMFRLARSSTSYIFFHPLAAAVLLGILGNTLRKIVLNQGVHWRGHSYVERGR